MIGYYLNHMTHIHYALKDYKRLICTFSLRPLPIVTFITPSLSEYMNFSYSLIPSPFAKLYNIFLTSFGSLKCTLLGCLTNCALTPLAFSIDDTLLTLEDTTDICWTDRSSELWGFPISCLSSLCAALNSNGNRGIWAEISKISRYRETASRAARRKVTCALKMNQTGLLTATSTIFTLSSVNSSRRSLHVHSYFERVLYCTCERRITHHTLATTCLSETADIVMDSDKNAERLSTLHSVLPDEGRVAW